MAMDMVVKGNRKSAAGTAQSKTWRTFLGHGSRAS